jgi:hypothetical protein
MAQELGNLLELPALKLAGLVVTDHKLVSSEIRAERRYLSPFTVEIRLEAAESATDLLAAIDVARKQAADELREVQQGYREAEPYQKWQRLETALKESKQELPDLQEKIQATEAKRAAAIADGKDFAAAEKGLRSALADKEILAGRVVALEQAVRQARQDAQTGLEQALQAKRRALAEEAAQERDRLQAEVLEFLEERLPLLIVDRVLCETLLPNRAQVPLADDPARPFARLPSP